MNTETLNTDREWDGEFIDEVDTFYKAKLSLL